MPNLTDRDIDQLSRAAAEFHDPDDSGLSWSKFEQQFRQQLPDKPPGRWSAGRLRPYAWGSVILALTGLTYLLTKNNHYTTNSTLTNGKQPALLAQPATLDSSNSSGKPTTAYSPSGNRSQSGSVKRTGNETSEPPIAAAKEKNSPVEIPGDGLHAASATTENAGGSASSDLKNTAAARDTYAARSRRIKMRRGIKNTVAVLNAHLEAEPFPAAAAALASESNPTDGAWLTETNSRKKTSSLNYAKLPDRQHQDFSFHSILSNDSLLNRFPSRSNPAASKHSDVNRSLVLGLVAGPDYTNGGGVTNDQLSDNIGLSLEYYLTRRLSVNTGLIYTKKYYWSKGDGFRIIGWPGIYFPVEFVNGTCNMWEIPLTIRYDFSLGSKTSFFINGGVSSYLMTKEDYTVFYHNGNRMYGKEFESRQHQNYLFSIVNISAGMERTLGRGFSFQVEPFLKLPTQGMGLGNIKLNSYGLLFSFRFAPALSRGRR